jgi:hypothetical protein
VDDGCGHLDCDAARTNSFVTDARYKNVFAGCRVIHTPIKCRDLARFEPNMGSPTQTLRWFMLRRLNVAEVLCYPVIQ